MYRPPTTALSGDVVYSSHTPDSFTAECDGKYVMNDMMMTDDGLAPNLMINGGALDLRRKDL